MAGAAEPADAEPVPAAPPPAPLVSDEPPAKSSEQAFLDGCSAAAQVLQNADVLFLCTGAGFSADSGLAVYGDIAKVPAYAALGVGYQDLCDPKWLREDRRVFYGFWGTCLGDYRSTRPHLGYEILAKWRDERFRDTEAARSIRRRIRRIEDHEEARQERSRGGPEPYKATGFPGAFFVFTSNVDTHSYDHFDACEVRECHGNIELWQCSGPCTRLLWRAPPDYGFHVDRAAMLCREGTAEDLPEDDPTEPDSGEVDAARPRLGRVRYNERPRALSGWPAYSSPAGVPEADMWRPNRPMCVRCERPARPAILMFGDSEWVDNVAQEQRYEAWLDAVAIEAQVRHAGGAGAEPEGDAEDDDAEGRRCRPLKVCILEIGCGRNVPTCLWNSQSAARKFSKAGAQCTLVRINPESPAFDGPAKSGMYRLLSIPGSGLSSLEKMDVTLMLGALLRLSPTGSGTPAANSCN